MTIHPVRAGFLPLICLLAVLAGWPAAAAQAPLVVVSGLSGDYTVASWVNYQGSGDWARVFDFGSGTGTNMWITPNAGGASGLRYAIRADNSPEQQISSNTVLPQGWHHVAVTVSGTTGTMYLDGEPIGTNNNMTISPADMGNTDQNWIGDSQYTADPFLNAAVDEDGVDPQEALAHALELAGQLDWDQAVRDGLSAMGELSRLGPVKKKKVGLLGFCLGGGLAFNVAAAATAAGRPPKALVSYYGSALPQLLDLAPQVECPSLHVFGTDDDYIPMEQVERIREAVTDGNAREQVRFELHEGAGHAFDNPNPLFFHEEASAAAWKQTQEFLAEALPVDVS